MEERLSNIYKAVVQGNKDTVLEEVQQSLNEEVPVEAILKNGLIKAMSEVGRLFQEGEFYVPEMLIAARAMQSGMDLLKPILAESQIQPVGKVVLGTVKGDLHDIGKNLVGMMLEGAGLEVIDLGTDVAPEKFAQEAVHNQSNVVAISALLTTTMTNMEDVIKALIAVGYRENVKVIVGGAPVTNEFAQRIGADGYAPDASRAVSVVKNWLG